ncbi:ferredoxin [Streptomyces sp. TLI_171]|uniref:ferredoxin n=1 Tax=Streptomyces sp. TLI_171 TaxID=1938859 RepID=UPI000C18595A|nr:ferredoxin [Streptomyces sp. TLI_171]RKE16992.1 hypothetical protein BX266_0242 [Streptomyces sp. TLI_171]
MTLYFDPLPHLGERDRHWLNVPGPFYGAETDNCLTGRQAATRRVLYDGERFGECVWRQPRDPAGTRQVLGALCEDPWGYGCDGDRHWTPGTVRARWHVRARVLEHLAAGQADRERLDAQYDQGTVAAVRAFEAYLADGLHHDLRIYLYWLQERRSPDRHSPLPAL